MPTYKITPFLSEIKEFFKKSDAGTAMRHISDILSEVKMDEASTIGIKSKPNNIYRLLPVFQWLLMMPCFGARNIFRGIGTPLTLLLEARKDVFYRFMENPSIQWRKAMWRISIGLWNKIHVRSDHHDADTCLILDDTDFPKTGKTIELIGRVHSHLEHKCIVGFKCLCMAITDGITQMVLDFAVLGEKGKNGSYGLSKKERSRRREVKLENIPESYAERVAEYDKTKIELAKEMIQRAIHKRVRFSYILADSWFTCKELVHFVKSRHVRCHWMGMIKVGEASKTKYHVDRKDMTAPQLLKHGKKTQRLGRSRRLKCHYYMFDGTFDGMPVRIFLVQRYGCKSWNGLLTTNTSLTFKDAWHIYSRRWSIEVIFKDCKTFLGLGKCQSTSFASQIAATTLSFMQYNILSVAKRFTSYETIGGLFRDAEGETVQLSIVQQIWGTIQEVVANIAEVFEISDEDIYDAILNKSEKLAHIFKFSEIKTAS